MPEEQAVSTVKLGPFRSSTQDMRLEAMLSDWPVLDRR